MIHYTLNTGDSADVSRRYFDPCIYDFFKPLTTALKTKEQVSKPLVDGLRIKATRLPGGVLFDLSDGTMPVAINGVAWTEEGAEILWDRLKAAYKKMDAGIITALTRPPSTLPWLTTITLPGYRYSKSARMIADLEQCAAMAFIKAHKKSPDC